jgi:hypothetical protein
MVFFIAYLQPNHDGFPSPLFNTHAEPLDSHKSVMTWKRKHVSITQAMKSATE